MDEHRKGDEGLMPSRVIPLRVYLAGIFVVAGLSEYGRYLDRALREGPADYQAVTIGTSAILAGWIGLTILTIGLQLLRKHGRRTIPAGILGIVVYLVLMYVLVDRLFVCCVPPAHRVEPSVPVVSMVLGSVAAWYMLTVLGLVRWA